VPELLMKKNRKKVR